MNSIVISKTWNYLENPNKIQGTGELDIYSKNGFCHGEHILGRDQIIREMLLSHLRMWDEEQSNDVTWLMV